VKRTLLATALAVAATAAVVASAAPPSPDIPAALEPAAREALADTLSAKGVQIYECRAESTSGPAWKFIAPEADLFDTDGEQIGLHGAGPFWQAVDGSRIVGQVKARTEAPTRGALPWLLLITQSTGAAGRFSTVTSIQRIDTVGGLAPAEPCTAELIGVRTRTPYTAIYRLFSLS
jgi:hypothetical protein